MELLDMNDTLEIKFLGNKNVDHWLKTLRLNGTTKYELTVFYRGSKCCIRFSDGSGVDQLGEIKVLDNERNNSSS